MGPNPLGPNPYPRLDDSTLSSIPSPLCKEWYDLGPSGMARSWPRDDEDIIQSPFKPSEPSPFLELPNFNHKSFRPDAAHTYAIAGWGKCLASSSVVLLCRLGLFGAGSIPGRLDEAFLHYKTWCNRFGKTTSITEFSLKAFEMSSYCGEYDFRSW